MKKNVKASVMLMWLCWLIYACSYTGKVNYSANINEVMSFYQVDHSTAGLASTFFFLRMQSDRLSTGFFARSTT